MVRGSAALMQSSPKHPGELKWQGTSPVGTTSAGLVVFEQKALRSGIIATFIATYQRAKEL
jgi:pyrroline-5-carboxylate reductase